MFNNMGRKIQALAVTLCWIGIGIFVIAGAFMFYFGFKAHHIGFMAIGVLILILGPLLSWLSIFTLYAFGDLVANVQEIKEQLYMLEVAPDVSAPEETSEPEPEPTQEAEPEVDPEIEPEIEPELEPEPEVLPEIEPEIALDAEQPQDSSDDYNPDDSQKEKYYEKYFS